MKAVLNSAYESLRKDIVSIPLHQYEVEEVYCNNRNVVEKAIIAGHTFVVKRYKRPTLFNCLIYTFFRKSKARRAYEYAVRLLKAGVQTPTPVAYIETSRNGFFHTGYFISEYVSYLSLEHMEDLSEEERNHLYHDFLHFTVWMHEKNIIHQDYNPANILYYKKNDKYEFSLIDINRMIIGKQDRRACMKAFSQQGFSLDRLVKFVEEYCRIRGWDVDETLFNYFWFRRKRGLQVNAKNRLKRFLGIKK